MNIADFHFIRPLWLLALVPWFIVLLMTARHRLNQGNWAKVCDEALLPYILQRKAVNRSRVSLTAGALAGLLTVVALAGPTWERLPAPVFRNESALVIALDLSRSMDAEDVKPSRLIRARYKIDDILQRRKDGQTALLVYAGDAFTVTPLTDDNDTIESQLPVLTTDIMPTQGSNVAIALEHARALLKQAGLRKGHILLVTDGIDYDAASAVVESLGSSYDVSVLGVGTVSGAPIRSAQGGFVKDRQGAMVVTKLDADELSRLATLGHGIYRTLSSDNRDINDLSGYFNRVREQGAGESDVRLQQWVEMGPWLLLPVLPLAALSFRRGLLAMSLVLLLPYPKSGYALDWQDFWQTRDQQGQKAYQARQFGQAAERFRNPQWKAAAQYKAGHYDQASATLNGINTAESLYNRGNALAQAGHLEEALKAYDQALKLDPKLQDAHYNKKIVEQALKKKQQNQDKGGQNRQKQNQQKGGQQSGQNSKRSEQQGDPSTQPGEGEPSQSQNDSGQQPQGQQSQSRQHDEGRDNADQTDRQTPERQQQADGKKSPDSARSDAGRPQDEREQANEQWLNRIPDDPGGLLRRKFLYQYGRRDHRPSGTTENW